MRRNLLRERLNAGEPTVGTHILSSWPTLVELIGHSGQYDYVEFTAEYAPFDMHDLDNLGRAFELTDLGGMIKIEQTQYTHQAMRAIGSGFQSVLFADIRTVEDAQACVDAVRAETTMATGARGRGRLGVGMRRDVGTVRHGGTPAYVDALNEVVIAIMVEKKSCVDDLDAILSVPGIDMVQFGASDYSMSIGMTGQHGHPEVLAAETQDHRDGAEEGPASARRAARSEPGRPLPRNGREALLHRLGRPHPGRLVGHQGRGDAQAWYRAARRPSRAGAARSRSVPTVARQLRLSEPPVAARAPARRSRAHGMHASPTTMPG